VHHERVLTRLYAVVRRGRSGSALALKWHVVPKG
jgi:hypothetical protein